MNKQDLIIFKEVEYGIKWYHYLVLLFPILFKPELYWFSIYGIIVVTFMRYAGFKAIDTQIDAKTIKHNNLHFSKNSKIKFDQIKSYKLVEFEVFFETKLFSLYKYYNSNKVSQLKYAIEIMLVSNKKVLIATKKPEELMALIKKFSTAEIQK